MVQQRPNVPRGTGFYGGVKANGFQIQAIRNLTRTGFTLDRIQSELRILGVGLRRLAISQIRREFQAFQRKQEGFKRVGRNARPSNATITSTFQNFGRKFRYTTAINAKNPFAFQQKKFFFRFSSDERLTRGQIESKTREIFGKVGQSGGDIEGSAGFIEEDSLEILGVEEGI